MKNLWFGLSTEIANIPVVNQIVGDLWKPDFMNEQMNIYNI